MFVSTIKYIVIKEEALHLDSPSVTLVLMTRFEILRFFDMLYPFLLLKSVVIKEKISITFRLTHYRDNIEDWIRNNDNLALILTCLVHFNY